MNHQDSKLKVMISRALCRAMRWDADTLSLKFEKDGYVSAKDLMEKVLTPELLRAKLLEPNDLAKYISADDERLGLRFDADGNVDAVRCYQGHSHHFYGKGEGLIDPECLFKEEVSLSTAYHNTDVKNLESIMREGLRPLHRHVHLWQENARKQGRQLKDGATLEVDLHRARALGLRFYEAGNGVILHDGLIPADCLRLRKTEEYVTFPIKLDNNTKQLTASLEKDLRASGLDWVVEMLTLGPKIQLAFRYNAELDLYIIMVKCKDDAALIKLGRKYGFPRGFIMLWEMGRTIDIRGFYPKFQNDKMHNNAGRDDVARIRFSKKWSGFLGSIVAWKHKDDGRTLWTVCSKNSADPESPYIQWAAELIPQGCLPALASERIYLGGEVMHPKDTHGYVAKEAAFVVTCMGTGLYVEVGLPHPATQIMHYWDHRRILAFCNAQGLLCDSVVIVNKEPMAVLEELLVRRDMIQNGSWDQLVAGLGERVEVCKGLADHAKIVGDCLEGIVCVLEKTDGSVEIEKVKFACYTSQTFGLRQMLEDMYPYAKHPLYKTVEMLAVKKLHFDWNKLARAIEKYVERWCSSDEGRLYYQTYLRCCMVLLSESTAEFLPRERVHIHLAELASRLSLDEMQAKALKFQVPMQASSCVLRVAFILGPVGSGKTKLMEILAAILGPDKCQAIDGDHVATHGMTFHLGDARNVVTKTKIFTALMNGQLPIVSLGGGVFCSHDVCTFQADVQRFFGMDCELLVAMPEMSDSRTAKEETDWEAAVQRVFSPASFSNIPYLKKVVERRKGPKGDVQMYSGISVKNERFAAAICRAASKVFTVPCMVNKAQEHSLFKGVKNMKWLADSLTGPVPTITLQHFNEVRAIVFSSGLKKEDRKHVTIGYGEAATFSKDLEAQLVGKSLWAMRFELQGEAKPFIVDYIPELNRVLTDGRKYAHVTVSTGGLEAKYSNVVLEHLMTMPKEEPLLIQGKTFIPPAEITSVEYKCVAVAAAMHHDFFVQRR